VCVAYNPSTGKLGYSGVLHEALLRGLKARQHGSLASFETTGRLMVIF
jgi:hypothetical protein